MRSCLGSFLAKRVHISRAPEIDAHWSVVFGELDENGAFPTLGSWAYLAYNFIPYSGLPGRQKRLLHPVYYSLKYTRVDLSLISFSNSVEWKLNLAGLDRHSVGLDRISAELDRIRLAGLAPD